MKCQKCNKAATMHITDVIAEEQFEEHHLCEDCAQKFLYEPPKKGAAKSAEGEEADEIGTLNQRQCPHCGIKFVEFRNSGRLGCPHDYDEFREELMPLLENIHGETRHVGKTPRRLAAITASADGDDPAPQAIAASGYPRGLRGGRPIARSDSPA